MNQRSSSLFRQHRYVAWIAIAVIILIGLGAGFYYYLYRFPKTPAEIYQKAQTAQPKGAVRLYDRLEEKAPAIEEYARLWKAQAELPNLEAVSTIDDLIAYRPHSPVAYQAHLVLALHFASRDGAAASEHYRQALELYDTPAIQMELARHLEDAGQPEEAYSIYRQLLSDVPDAFAGMRRTAPDPLTAAEDLCDAYYYTDALEALRGVTDPEALQLRARALRGLGRLDEAEELYRAWTEEHPDDESAQLELGKILGQQGETEEAIAIYEASQDWDSALAQANLLESSAPTKALSLYMASPYPVAWWSATTMLESQGRITESLPLYEQVAQSDSYLADDAGFRLWTLGQRLGLPEWTEKGRTALESNAFSWLSHQANPDIEIVKVRPSQEPWLGPIAEKVEALDALGRSDLADLELVLAVQHSDRPERDLAAAQDLSDRGLVLPAQRSAALYVPPYTEGASLEFWQLAYPRPYREAVESAAQEFDIDPLLIWAIMRQESSYDALAHGYSGERGMLQIMPATQDWIAEELGQEISPGEAFEPKHNARMSAWLLRWLLDYFEGDLAPSIAGYNAGASTAQGWLEDERVSDRGDWYRWIAYGTTREYVENVLLYYEVYKTLYNEE